MTVQDAALLEPELVAIIRKFVGRRRPITPSAAIYHDLRIAGDDAFELFEMIVARFGTSFDEFDWTTYFPNETQIGPIWWLAEWLGHRETKWRCLTVGHLQAVIERGAWFNPKPSDEGPRPA